VLGQGLFSRIPRHFNIWKFVLDILPLQRYTVISADELQRALHRLT